MLHLVSHGVPPAYLNFLQTQKIPYLIAGDERVDLPQIMAKIKNKLGIGTLLATAGSARRRSPAGPAYR